MGFQTAARAHICKLFLCYCISRITIEDISANCFYGIKIIQPFWRIGIPLSVVFFIRAAREPARVLWVLHTVPTENIRFEYVCGEEARQLTSRRLTSTIADVPHR